MSTTLSDSAGNISKFAFVGARVSQGPFRGTIRFIGNVPPTKGVWLGIEWDDVSRGKHDGIHEGKRYFVCKNQQNSGSFVKANSTKISFGSSFLQALRHKYVTPDQQRQDEDTFNLDIPNVRQFSRRNLADIEIEAPNLEGVRKRNAQLDRLREVGLGGWKMEGEGEQIAKESYEEVARAFDEEKNEKKGEIANTCPSIRYLDLSRSLIPSWTELAKMTVELSHLETLLLHFNRFASIKECLEEIPQNAFAKLKDLRIDGTLTNWPEMCQLARYMPMLETVQMASNELKRLEHGANQEKKREHFQNLKQLNLANNEIDDWKDLIEALEVCPNLERLIVSDNKVQSIPPLTSQKQNRIGHITLNKNPVSTWTDLDNLMNWCPNLQSLSIDVESCPFLLSIEQRQDVRPLLIARLFNLKTLNSATISETERKDAELFYLSKVNRDSIQKDEEQIQSDHPRLFELRKKYGQLEDQKQIIATNSNSNTQKATLRSKLLPVIVHLSTCSPSNKPPYFSPPPEGSKEGVQVDLLTTIPIRLLKGKLARTLKIQGGMKNIQSIWALLSPQIDPSLIVAVQLRSEMRPGQQDQDEERIIYPLDNIEWDLQQYNITKDDQLIVVVND